MKFHFILFFSMFMFSCTSDNEEDVFGLNGSECETEGVYYNAIEDSKSISTIIADKCLNCHYLGNVISGVSLEDYEALVVYKNLDDIINSTINPMPPSGVVQLTDCEKLQIESWVNNGLLYDEIQR